MSKRKKLVTDENGADKNQKTKRVKYKEYTEFSGTGSLFSAAPSVLGRVTKFCPKLTGPLKQQSGL